jgi:hypothetical protein
MKKILFIQLIIILALACEEPVAVPDSAASEKRRIQSANDSIMQEARQIIQTGDLLLRTGTDFSSDQVKDLCKVDRTFSHGGIAVIENDIIYVYHVEPDYYYVRDKVRKELLDSFWNPANNYGFGIARYNLSSGETSAFISYLEEQYRKKIPFDMKFNLETDDQLYCSEMIKKGLARSTQHRITIATDRLNDRSKYRLIKRYFKLEEKQFANREVVMVDRLFVNPHCSLIKKYLFTGH